MVQQMESDNFKWDATSTLMVHCKSEDDNLGEHVLCTGDNYNWWFKENFWISTFVLVPF